MREFLDSGHLALLALLVLGLETLALIVQRHRLPARPAIVDIALMALPGACLLLAVYCAQSLQSGVAVALALTMSLPAHLADLARRLRAPRP